MKHDQVGIGDPPAIFLIFMAAFFPIVLSTPAAVANIPSVFFRVARDLGISGARLLGAPSWDPDFNTADLPLMMRLDDLPARYRRHFLAG